MSSEPLDLPEGALAGLAGRAGRVVRAAAQGRGLRIGIVCAAFNGQITLLLLDGALAELASCGVDPAQVSVDWVPGAFELPLAAQVLAVSGAVDAVMCLGAVIRGETGHYDMVAGQCAAGIARVALDTGVPVVFGVLTTHTVAQARARAGQGGPNRGRDSARTAVEMARLVAQLAQAHPPSLPGHHPGPVGGSAKI